MRSIMPLNEFSSDPFRMLDEVERDMKRFLDVIDGRSLSRNNLRSEFFAPAYDISDKDTHFVMSFDLPGIPKDEIKIDVRDGQLLVSGERKSEKTEGGYSERHYGRFERRVSLPNNIDESNIEAHYSDGVLSIALPKTEQTQAKKISISEGKKEGLWNKLLGHSKKDDTNESIDVKTKSSQKSKAA